MMKGSGQSSGISQVLRSGKKYLGGRVASLFAMRKWSRDTFPVRVVITGIEHSGTTLLSMLLKQDPSLDSGFECGFLLADSPREFKDVHPWYEWMQEPVTAHQWGVSAEHMESICSSKSWEEAYRKLLKYSPVFDHERTQQICDKTPRYLSCLDSVLDKLPDFVPCIVIEKDIEGLWRSHKKRNALLEDFCLNFERYNSGLLRAVRRHGDRIHRVKYEALCNDLPAQLKHIFSIVGLPFKEEYGTNRQGNIQQYFSMKNDSLESFSETERACLDRLKKQCADLRVNEN